VRGKAALLLSAICRLPRKLLVRAGICEDPASYLKRWRHGKCGHFHPITAGRV